MYVALRPTFDCYPDGTSVKRYPGDTLETFHLWPARNQMAALSVRMVRFVPDSAPLSGHELYKPQHTAEIREAKKAAMEALVKKDEHACPDCEVVCQSAHGLAIHKGREHKAKR